MKKIVSIILVFMILLVLMPSNISTVKAENKKFSVVSYNSKTRETKATVGELTFEVSNGYPLKKITEFKAVNGEASMPELANGYYQLSLKENEYYELSPVGMDVSNGSYVIDEEDEDSTITVTVKANVVIPTPDSKKDVSLDILDESGNKITKQLTFELIKSGSGAKELKSNEGTLVLKEAEDGEYTIKLKDDDVYMMTEEAGYQISINNGKSATSNISLKKKANTNPDINSEEKVEKALLVVDEQSTTLGTSYQFKISNNQDEKIVNVDNNGAINVEVVNGKTYTISLVDNDKYEMEPITVKCTKAEGAIPGTVSYKLLKDDGSELSIISVKTKKNVEPAKEEKQFTFNVLCGTCGRIAIEMPLTFEVKNKKTDEVKEYVSNSGQVKMILTEGEEYLIKLKENKEYKHDDVSLIIKREASNLSAYTDNEKVFTEFVMTKKDTSGQCVESLCEFSDNKVTMAPIPVKVSENGLLRDLKAEEEMIFNLYNTSRSERVGEVKTVNGVIPALEVFEKDDYILFTSGKNNKFIMADTPFRKEVSELYFRANGEGNLPIRHKTKNPYAEGANLNINFLQVRPLQNGETINERYTIDYVRIKQDKSNPKDYSKLKFIFTSEYETITATTLDEDDWGVPLTELNLIENVQYSVRVEDPDNKYAIENFPFVLVDKSERGPNHPQHWGDGKYVFNHSYCGNATYLTLVEKGKENDHNTIVKCSNGHTTISGMNFRDLLLRTIRPDKNEITSMKGKDFDLFRFKLINPKRCEVTKMAEGDFVIHREIPKDKRAVNVYQVNKDKSLSKLEFKQNDNIVDIKTKTLSIYDTVIEYSKIDTNEKNPDIIKPEYNGEKQNETARTHRPYINRKEKKNYAKKDTDPVTRKEEKNDYGIVDSKELLPVALNDIPNTEAGTAIKSLVSRGILAGMGNGKFQGELPVTRTMVAAVLMRISADKNIHTDSNFTDVKTGDWYSGAVKWAASSGLFVGYPDGSFKPNKLLTRQELAVIIQKFLALHNINMEEVKAWTYDDLDKFPVWSKDSIIAMAKMALVKGQTDTMYNPTSEFTREELAVMLYKIIIWVESHR